MGWIRDVYKGDAYIQSMSRMAKTRTEGPYTQHQGLLLFKGRVIIPSQEALWAKLMLMTQQLRDTGVLQTFKRLAQ